MKAMPSVLLSSWRAATALSGLGSAKPAERIGTTTLSKSETVPIRQVVCGSTKTTAMGSSLKASVCTCPTSPDKTVTLGKTKTHRIRCAKAMKRMTFWYDIVADAEIPTFSRPLKYASNGADMDLRKVIDRDMNAYPHAKRTAVRDRVEKRGNKNLQKGHLVVSNNPMHSAKKLCDHSNSKGLDFVSTSEGIYCDMETSEWWNLCSVVVTSGCFDLDKEDMRGNVPGHKGLNGRDMLTGRDIPKKDYKTINTRDA